MSLFFLSTFFAKFAFPWIRVVFWLRHAIIQQYASHVGSGHVFPISKPRSSVLLEKYIFSPRLYIVHLLSRVIVLTRHASNYKTYVYKDLIHNRRFYRGSEPLENHRDFMFFAGLTAVFRSERIENIFGHWEIWLTLFLLLKNVFFKLVFYDHNVPELWCPSIFRKTTSKVACITAIDGLVLNW